MTTRQPLSYDLVMSIKPEIHVKKAQRAAAVLPSISAAPHALGAVHHERVERQTRLFNLLPLSGTPSMHCLDGAALLKALDRDAAYGKASNQARRRALQHDLKALVDNGYIEAVNPGGKPLRYRRLNERLAEDSLIFEFAMGQVRDLVETLVPTRQFDSLWQRLAHSTDGQMLDASRLRCVSDTFRLQAVELYPEVLTSVIAALATGHALKVRYASKGKSAATARIHPQALVQRGPIPYLFALKNDELDPVRLYALHRMIRAEVLTDTPAHQAEGFDLDQAIASGHVDFGHGTMIALELRVRGYLTDLLETCRLNTDQVVEDEPEDSEFERRVSATVPSTGQLLRWLLGAGDNVEVLAPPELRKTVAVQAAKMVGVYREPCHPQAEEGKTDLRPL